MNIEVLKDPSWKSIIVFIAILYLTVLLIVSIYLILELTNKVNTNFAQIETNFNNRENFDRQICEVLELDCTWESDYKIGYDELDWDCPEKGDYGTTEECIKYWDSLVTLEKNEGRYKALQKLNNDGHLSDFTRGVIFEIEGLMLPDLDEIQMEKEK